MKVTAETKIATRERIIAAASRLFASKGWDGTTTRDIAVAAAYYEDKLATQPRRLYYGGVGVAEDFARWTRMSDAELKVVDLAPRPTTGAATPLGNLSFAGITGALAGAA